MMRLPFFLRLVFNRFFFQKMAAIALLGLFLYALSDFLSIFLITFLFGFLFLDLSNWLLGKILAFSHRLSPPVRNVVIRMNKLPVIVTGVYVAFIVGVVFLFSNLVPQVLEESKGIISEIPGIARDVERNIAWLESSMQVDLGLRDAINSYFDKQAMEQTAKDVFENVRNAGILL